jgi:hypothetical protein
MMTFDDQQRTLSHADVLSAVFAGAGQRPAPDEQVPDCSVHVIPQGGEPRWIIVGNPRKALPVLESWNPWNPGSRLRWRAVKAAAGTGLLPRIPGVQSAVVKIDVSYWRDNLPKFPNDWTGVIHVGNRSQSRKAILFVIGQNRAILFAAKVPLVSGAAEAIFNEAKVLDQLKQFAYLPRVLFRDCGRGVAVQSWLDGKPVSRGFAKPHLKLLSTLAIEGVEARVSDFRSEVAAELNEVDLPFDRSVLMRGLELLEYDKALPRFVEHRDFAPWNLKWLPDGELGLLDWEWAVSKSLPWQDACRMFYLEDFHFKGPGNVWEQMIADPLLTRYRRQFEIPAEALPALTMRYMLRVLPMDWLGGNHARAQHTFKQIQFLLATRSRAVPAGQEGGYGSRSLGVRNWPA